MIFSGHHKVLKETFDYCNELAARINKMIEGVMALNDALGMRIDILGERISILETRIRQLEEILTRVPFNQKHPAETEQ